MLFLAVGAVSAAESIDVSDTEDSNIIGDDADALSADNKLEISNEDSISLTNIVNSHDDNLGNCPDGGALNASYEDDYHEQLTSNDVEAAGENTLCSTSSSSDSVISESSSNDIVGAGSSGIVAAGASTKLSVTDAHYGPSATYFDVTLNDNSGKGLTNQKITLNVNGKSYTGLTNEKGVASIKTDMLNVGSYAVSLVYEGDSAYSPSSLSKNVNVLPSVIGSDAKKGYGTKYKVTFWKDNTLLSNTNVTFIVNGKTYTETTDDEGVASLKLDLPVGKYTVTAVNPYSKQSVSYKVTVTKEKTKFTAKGKTYVATKKKGTFKVVLKTKHNKLLKNKKVTITFRNKKVTVKTNKKGEAKMTIPALGKGTYKISYSYKGSKNYCSQKGSANIVVADPTTKLSSKILVMKYNDGSKFQVKLTNSKGKALANKKVKITVKGKTVISKTNKKGIAKISLKNVVPGSHVAKYSYSTAGSKDYSHGSNRVIILKIVAKVSAKDLTMNANTTSEYKVTVKDKSGKPLSGVSVKSTIGKGKSKIYKTDSNGVARLNVAPGTGNHKVKTIVADPYYKSAPVTKHILVKGTKVVANNLYVSGGKSVTYSVKVVNEKKKPVKDKEVVFTFNGKNITSKTDSKGIAKANLGELARGTHKIGYTQDYNEGSANIYVANKVTLKNLLKASQSVKKYISKHHKLPSSVKIGDVSFKTADYLYLASKAIVNLKAGNKKAISINIVKNPSDPKSAKNLGYLKNYLGVAKKVVKAGDTKGQMPNSVSSKIGTIGYDGVVSLVSKVLASYDKNKKLPKYVKVKSLSGSSASIKGVLNTKNKIKNLVAYLAASKNCEVNSAKIKKLVAKLTKNCKSDKEKATKIFNYVRDTISYSFYYNTRYGALGTLNARSGNCVDHAHILVAMYRAAGLPARYVHGTCHFSSGNTYGHVWAQVLVGDTWTVADATSSRNSFGHVVNWNTHSYKFQGYYQSLPF